MRSSRRDHDDPIAKRTAARATRRELLGLAALGVLAAGTKPARAADGQLVYGSHISLAPAWFDPAETPGIVTPFMLLYALHDGLVKPMPGKPADRAWRNPDTASADGLTHSFVLRAGATFHNGEPVTAEDVKFSFERYRGNAARFIKEQVAAVETPDPRHVVFRLQQAVARFPASTIPASPAPAGSCRRNMSRASARTASRRRRSAPAPTSSSRSPRASNW